MARKLTALEKEWEARLASEGLAPITNYSVDAVHQRRLKRRLLGMTAAQRGTIDSYYSRANKFLRRIELAHAVWQLHCQGLGRREIAARLGITGRSAKKVRLVLQRLHGISGLVPPSFGGED